ncbi:O-antigen ligase family protein [Adhaeribacter swui]|uniref:O-antigen ligase family protein n=1 Tax=Adhaeribacter swui TaxID=2086471 RepID=A0A7G7G3V4_9BACT|nr:O-antigen ligase family protein [Adhaeribacter swui]QNF31838.1 O-antigen ligase family protein [Adhaeribacter swui]
MRTAVTKPWTLFEPQDSRTQRLYFGLCALFLIGLFFSRALITAVPVALLILALTANDFSQKFKILIKNWSALGLAAIYGLLLVSIIYTQDAHNWGKQVYRYAGLFLFPVAGGLLPPLRAKQIYILLYFYLLLTTIITIGTMGQYFSNIQAYNELITHSQNPPTINRIFHIHFGVMMTLSIFFAVYIYRAPWVFWQKKEKYLALLCALILVTSMHILAYRTGLLALYVTLIFKIFWFIKTKKKYLLGVGLLAILFTVPVVAYFSLESVRFRVENTRTDISRYVQHQDINYYSIAQRLAAWETAFAVIKKNALVGVGLADVKMEMRNQYAVQDFNLKKENQVMIHNQYLHILMGSGIIGLILFLGVLLYPFYKLQGLQDWCLSAFLLTCGTAMLVDSFFELQRGLNLFAFFYLLLIVQKEQRVLTQNRFGVNEKGAPVTIK